MATLTLVAGSTEPDVGPRTVKCQSVVGNDYKVRMICHCDDVAIEMVSIVDVILTDFGSILIVIIVSGESLVRVPEAT